MRITLYIVASLPLALVAFLAAAWWSTLPRPWLFAVAGALCLYLLLAVIAGIAVFIGPGVGSYFLEAPNPSITSTRSFPVAELVAVAIFLALGTVVLWVFKQWQLQP